MTDAILIVMAKGCSTRVKNKNIVHVGGRPLLHYVFDHVREMTLPVDAVVMTECPLVAAECQEFRVCSEVTTGDPPVCRRVHWAVEELERERGRPYKWALLVNADTPVRPAELFDEALTLARETGADVVQSVMETPVHFHPYRNYIVRHTGDVVPLMTGVDLEAMSQDYPTFVSITGGILVLKRSALAVAGFIGTRHPSLHVRAVRCDVNDVVEIDTPEDLEAFRQRIEDGDVAGLSRSV